MGAKGPVPMLSEELARPRPAGHQATIGTAYPATAPVAHAGWDDTVRALYDSLKESGQSDFYQQSDWSKAVVLCDELQRYRDNARHSAEMLRTILDGFDSLGATEQSRRRMGIELDRVVEQTGLTAGEAAVIDYKRALGLTE